MKPFNKVEFFSRLWMNLTKMNIDPRSLTIDHWTEADGEYVKGTLHKNKRSAFSFLYKITPADAIDNSIDYWGLAADRAAFCIERNCFPNKIDWAIAFEKRLDELIDEEKSK